MSHIRHHMIRQISVTRYIKNFWRDFLLCNWYIPQKSKPQIRPKMLPWSQCHALFWSQTLKNKTHQQIPKSRNSKLADPREYPNEAWSAALCLMSRFIFGPNCDNWLAIWIVKKSKTHKCARNSHNTSRKQQYLDLDVRKIWETKCQG